MTSPATPYPFPHFMLKEIYEQPDAIRHTIDKHRTDYDLDTVASALRAATKIVIAASGSSRHAGLAGEIMIEDLADLACDVEYASEYCYRRPRLSTNHIVLVITQSGETGDTLLAQREALARGAKTVAVSNVENATIAREATAEFLTCAGAEIAIPATKSFTAQLTAMYLFALKLARMRNALPSREIDRQLAELDDIPHKLEASLDLCKQQALEAARASHDAKHFIFLGRGIHYAIAREGALKLKEISLLYAEGLPAGEFRHGPTALVDASLPIVLIATRDHNDEGSTLRYQKTLEIAQEIKSRKGRVIAVANQGDLDITAIADHVMYVPHASEHLLPILEVVPLQFFAYHIATLNGLDVDKPRNLVKSVVSD